jgi:DNA-binding FadR family transcriptional regulator
LNNSLAHHHELVSALTAHDLDWAESVMRSHTRSARPSPDRYVRVLARSGGETADTQDRWGHVDLDFAATLVVVGRT